MRLVSMRRRMGNHLEVAEEFRSTSAKVESRFVVGVESRDRLRRKEEGEEEPEEVMAGLLAIYDREEYQ